MTQRIKFDPPFYDRDEVRAPVGTLHRVLYMGLHVANYTSTSGLVNMFESLVDDWVLPRGFFVRTLLLRHYDVFFASKGVEVYKTALQE